MMPMTVSTIIVSMSEKPPQRVRALQERAVARSVFIVVLVFPPPSLVDFSGHFKHRHIVDIINPATVIPIPKMMNGSRSFVTRAIMVSIFSL